MDQTSCFSLYDIDSCLDSDPVKVDPHTLVLEVVHRLVQQNQSLALIVEDSCWVGQWTPRDLMHLIANQGDVSQIKIGQVMSVPGQSLGLRDLLDPIHCLQLMQSQHLDVVPLLNETGEILGTLMLEKLRASLTLNGHWTDSLLQDAHDALFIVDPDTQRILACNPRAVQLFAAESTSDWLNQTLQPYILTTSFDLEAVELDRESDHKLECVTFTGQVFWGRLKAQPLFVGKHRYHLIQIAERLSPKIATDRPLSHQRLQESEQRFQALFHQSGRFICLLDAAGRLVEANSVALDLMNMSAEALTGELFWQLKLWKTPALIHQAIETVLHDQITHLEVEVIGQGNRCLSLELSIKAVANAAGTFQMLIVEGQDVTDRVWAQRILRTSESRYQGIFEQAAVGIYQLNEQGQFIDVNPAFCQIVGYAPEELFAREEFEITYPDDQVIGLHTFLAWSESLVESEGQQSSHKIDKRYCHKNGSTIWVQITLTLVYNLQGLPCSFIGIIEDITWQKLAQDDLRQAYQRLTYHIDNSPLGYVEWDHQVCVKYWSPQAEAIFGWQDQEVLGLYWEDWPFIFEDDRERVNLEIKPLLQGHLSSCKVQNRNYRKDGTIIYCEWYNSILLDEAGQVISMISQIKDITVELTAIEALKASEARYRTLIDHFPNGVVHLFDQDFRFIISGGQESSEINLDELEGKTIWEALPPEIVTEIEPYYHQALQGNSSESEMAIETRTYYCQHLPVRNDHDQIVAGMVVMQDITLQKQAAAQLQASKERYRQLFELSPLPMWILDAHTLHFLTVNQAAVDHYGYSREQFSQMHIRDLEARCDAIGLQQTRRSLSNLAPTEIYRHLKQNGTQVYVEAAAHPIEWNSKPAELVIINDVTHRVMLEAIKTTYQDRLEATIEKRTQALLKANQELAAEIEVRRTIENALRSSEEQLQLFIEHAPAAIAMFDRDLNYMAVSQRWITDYHLIDQDLIGRSHYDIFPHLPPEWKALHQSCLYDQAHTCQAYTCQVHTCGEAIFSHVDGSQDWIRWDLRPWKDRSGQIGGLIMFTEVITEQKVAQEELKQLNQKLQASNSELEQFAYVASHDLQEPLRAITSYTELLAKRYQNALDEKADKYIHYIVEGATRMKALIQDLLGYAHISRYDFEFTATDCNQVLTEVIKNLDISIQESQAQLIIQPLPTVRIDRLKILQVFQNLLSNAIKYRSQMPPIIQIKAELEPPVWHFTVQDNGMGIDPEYADRIFIIFQRLHTRKVYPGTGIGLAICKKIIERHGGHIWVESQLGHGSTFHITIPAESHSIRELI